MIGEQPRGVNNNRAEPPPKGETILYGEDYRQFSAGAEGRTRTDMEVTPQQFLRLPRLPIPPLRLFQA